MIDEKIVKDFKFEQPPGGKVHGVASSDDIGFKFQGEFVSLQNMFERRDKWSRINAALIAVAVVVALSHAFCHIFIL